MRGIEEKRKGRKKERVKKTIIIKNKEEESKRIRKEIKKNERKLKKNNKKIK